MISGREAIWLVAWREISTRAREKSFVIGLVVTLVIIAGIIFLPQVLGGGPKTATVAAGAGDASAVLAGVGRAGDEFDIKVKVVRERGDAQARAAVENEDADLAVVEDGTRLIVGADAPDEAVQAVQAAARSAQTLERLREAGVDGTDAQRILTPPSLAVTDLADDNGALQAFATVTLVLLYMQILGAGFTVAAGVVEEKASRIVEILLATVKPHELLAGKVLGIGLLLLGQLLVIGVVGLGLAAVSGQFTIGAAELGALPVMLGWFLLGFAFYSGCFAVAGALISRQEDLGSVTMPMSLILLATFFLGFQALDDPSGILAQVLSLVPLTSPLVMPVRMIISDVPLWEVALAVLLSLAAIVLIVRLAGRVYASAVLQTKGRVSLQAALRQS